MATDARTPTVGVIVPVFNGGRFLADALDSLRAQTLTDWQCVVVDDGSTDDTADVAQRMVETDPRFRLIRQRNAGTPTARNAGIAAIDPGTPFLSFLDGDDTLTPDALQVLVDALERAPHAVSSYGFAEYMLSSGEPYAPGVHRERQRDRRQLGRFDLIPVLADAPYTWSSWIVSGTLWPSAVALHRRAVVDDVGRFDTELRQLQDWDLYLRMSRQGPFVPVDTHVAWYRQHAQNVTSRTERVALYSLHVRRRVATSDKNTAAQRREVRRVSRRLAMRWTVRCAQGFAALLRAGNVRASADAAAATAAFARIGISGRPPEPTPRLADYLARFVMTRHSASGVLTDMAEHQPSPACR